MHRMSTMSETTQQPSSREPPPEPAATAGTGPACTNPAIEFARRHPALTLIGAAGVGLIGGLELVAGVAIGAGVSALVRARDGRAIATEAREVRGRARTLVGRLPHEVRKRARAVLQAARGKLDPVTR